jgi:surfeit locus 1 family protein
MSSLVTVLLLPLFVYLGCWQLQRMHQKEWFEKAIAHQSNDTIIQLDRLAPTFVEQHFDQFQYRQVSLTGRFLANPIFLDNQILDKQLGYRVLMPFLLTNHNHLILIDRGWIPNPGSRNILPSISARTGTVTLTGNLIQIKPGLILQKESIPTPASWPIRVQSIDYTVLSKILEHPLLQFIVQLSAGQPDGFKTLPLNIGMPSKRHLGYALQWFTMAIVILIYYGVINIKRRPLCKKPTL